MPRERHRWDPVCDPPQNLYRPVRIDPSGRRGPTRGQAAGPRWRRVSRGWHVPAWIDPAVPEQRILEASLLLPAQGAVTGWGALRLLGAAFLDGLAPDGRTHLPVNLCIGPGQNRRPRPGIRFCRDRLEPDEVVTTLGIPHTTALRATFDTARKAPGLRAATTAMDMSFAAQLTSPARLRSYLARRAGWDGIPQVRAALPLTSERSLSPMETEMRLVWVLDAGLPPPKVNQEVWDLDGKLLGVADLLDVEAGVAGEYDGGEHLRAGRRSRDVAKEDRFRSVGLEVFRVLRPDMADTSLVVDRMLRARRRALWLPRHKRRWTIQPPPGAAYEPSLDEVLDQRDWHRGVLTEHERTGGFDPEMPWITRS